MTKGRIFSICASCAALLVVFLPFLGGCKEGGHERDVSYSRKNDIAAEFDEGAGRPPNGRTLLAGVR